MFPVSAGVAGAAHSSGGDLGKMPVGLMVSILKMAMGAGHRRYTPLDFRALPNAPAPHIEPGRLEVR
jgi:hypothetical protein